MSIYCAFSLFSLSSSFVDAGPHAESNICKLYVSFFCCEAI